MTIINPFLPEDNHEAPGTHLGMKASVLTAEKMKGWEVCQDLQQDFLKSESSQTTSLISATHAQAMSKSHCCIFQQQCSGYASLPPGDIQSSPSAPRGLPQYSPQVPTSLPPWSFPSTAARIALLAPCSAPIAHPYWLSLFCYITLEWHFLVFTTLPLPLFLSLIFASSAAGIIYLLLASFLQRLFSCPVQGSVFWNATAKLDPSSTLLLLNLLLLRSP